MKKSEMISKILRSGEVAANWDMLEKYDKKQILNTFGKFLK